MIIETERLILREWTEKDAAFLFKLNSDPKVIKFTGDPPFNSAQDALELIKSYKDYITFGYGRWICELKSNGQAIGWAGLKNQMANEGIIDIGFRFLKSHWNMGFGYEAAQDCLKFGFGKLDLHKITGRTAEENHYSHKILKKIGLREENEKRDCHGIQATYYSLTNLEYQKINSQIIT